MRKIFIASVSAALLAGVFVISTPDSAEARRCYTFKESHNGTDMFNPDGGAKTAATIKLHTSIELWQQKKGIKKVRIGKVKTKCGEWYVKYLLPHHTCTARARVCT